jgi:hypothetical protein
MAMAWVNARTVFRMGGLLDIAGFECSSIAMLGWDRAGAHRFKVLARRICLGFMKAEISD